MFKLKVFKLTRKGPVNWDENVSITVIAHAASEARNIAAEAAADEGPEVWTDKSKSRCEMILLTEPMLLEVNNKGA